MQRVSGAPYGAIQTLEGYAENSKQQPTVPSDLLNYCENAKGMYLCLMKVRVDALLSTRCVSSSPWDLSQKWYNLEMVHFAPPLGSTSLPMIIITVHLGVIGLQARQGARNQLFKRKMSCHQPGKNIHSTKLLQPIAPSLALLQADSIPFRLSPIVQNQQQIST